MRTLCLYMRVVLFSSLAYPLFQTGGGANGRPPNNMYMALDVESNFVFHVLLVFRQLLCLALKFICSCSHS